MKSVSIVLSQADDLWSFVGTLFLMQSAGWQINCYFCGLTDRSASDIDLEIEIKSYFIQLDSPTLELTITKERPQLIITHSPQSHIADQEKVSQFATQLAYRHQVALWYATPLSFLRGFEPNFFVDISQVIQQKVATAKTWLHLDTVLVLSRFWARELGRKDGYFECFYVVKFVITADYFREQAWGQVVTIHAHGDDEVLPCAGTLYLMSQAGCKVHCVVLTDGNHSSSPIKGLRQKEAIAAGKLIGTTYEFHNLAECAFTAQEVIKLTEQVVQRLQPDLIITHTPQPEKYGHRDHEICALGVANTAIRRQIALWYSAPPVFMRGFIPNLFVDISSVIQTKIDAIHCYESESSKSFMQLDSIINLSRFWARELGHFEGGYYEALQIDRQIIDSQFFA